MHAIINDLQLLIPWQNFCLLLDSFFMTFLSYCYAF